jgi:LuxR family maltose regulon positive regulatory protein
MDQILVRVPGEVNTQREVRSSYGELLATKSFVPVSPHALISRPRLSALLDAGLQRQLTLVSAPAGFGKTTLLSTWAKSHAADNPHVAWVTLDEGDNAPRRFWAYVLTALDRCEPGTSVQALQLLHAHDEPPLEEALTALINRLSDVTSLWALILDDYQVINEPAIQRQLSFLVEHLPPQVHVMLATRTDPPLPLSRWRVRDQLLEVRTDQLRATEEETGALLHQLVGITLENSLLQEITARTEGWLAGLRLVGLALQGCADPTCMLEGARGSERYIQDYVTEEVLRQQEPAMYTFLLRTSILSQLTAPLCDAVLEPVEGQEDSQQVLEELERTNVFLVPLDRQRRWYRYHSLFAEALRTRLEQVSGEEVRTLYLRASRWYEQEGNIAEAVQHALRAHAWERAADLIESMSQKRSGETSESQMVAHWVEQLPADVVCTRPQIGQLSGRRLMRADNQLANELCTRGTETGGRAVQTVEHSSTADAVSLVRNEQEHQRETQLASSMHIADRFRVAKDGLELLLLDPLTDREREVLHLVAQGASNAEIAAMLIVEVNTVKRHMGNIMSKLQAGNRTQAVAQARVLGLLAEVA